MGIVFVLLGPIAIIMLISQAYQKISEAYNIANASVSESAKAIATSAATNTFLQWAIIIFIFIPIALGMVVFGKYAWQEEYSN